MPAYKNKKITEKELKQSGKQYYSFWAKEKKQAYVFDVIKRKWVLKEVGSYPMTCYLVRDVHYWQTQAKEAAVREHRSEKFISSIKYQEVF